MACDYQLAPAASIAGSTACRALTQPGGPGYAARNMSSVESTTPAADRSGAEHFREAWRQKPVRTSLGLAIEYGMFASAVGLAAGLFLTRWPMRAVDRATGLRLRERFIELLARISPG
jgi:hypothetical protein